MQMKLELRDLHLPMRHPFTIAHGTTTIQHNLLVELQQDGVTGYGEGASCDAYPEFTADSMRAALEAARPQIERETLDGPGPALGPPPARARPQPLRPLRAGRGGARPLGQAARRARLAALGPGAAQPAPEQLHHRH